MGQGPIIPKGTSKEEKKALRHSGGHGPDGPTGQRADGGRVERAHKPFNPDKGYTGQRK